MSKCPSSNATLKRAVILSLATTLIASPAIALAGTACEQGRITFMELKDGDSSEVLLRTDNSPSSSWQKAYPSTGGAATVIWYKASDTRWRDRLSLLRMAFSLQLPVKISSSDDNCMGPTDEFTITVCSVDGPC